MISKALAAASTKPMILAILKEEESYGYQIVKRAKAVSGGELEWAEGMLYPVLHRMSREGLVETEWKISSEGRRRKYYRITEAGIEELEKEMGQWVKMNNIFSALMSSVEPEGCNV